MLTIRRATDRFRSRTDWLDSRHSFSFGEHYHPEWMGFRSLRVINEDVVAPGAGFPTHAHRDMEIVSYVLEGALEHKDSLGTGSVIRAGDIQRMTAGTGVRHSEYNATGDAPTHFLQIWILPERPGLPPSYEQKAIPAAAKSGALVRIASRNGGAGEVTVHQDAAIYTATLAPEQEVSHALAPGRHVWVQVVRGSLTVDGNELGAGDGAAVSGVPGVNIAGKTPAELLLFDLA
jgi:redox-sensitive bicupin YhaK (pirin superfamily)